MMENFLTCRMKEKAFESASSMNKKHTSVSLSLSGARCLGLFIAKCLAIISDERRHYFRSTEFKCIAHHFIASSQTMSNLIGNLTLSDSIMDVNKQRINTFGTKSFQIYGEIDSSDERNLPKINRTSYMFYVFRRRIHHSTFIPRI